MSQQPDRSGSDVEDDGPLTVRDDELPSDVQPRDDNPLAEPAGEEGPDPTSTQGVADEASGADSVDATAGDDDASGTSSQPASSEPVRPSSSPD